jgi:gamma-glutamylcyclotransferase (GGCT)/AIG2-like uncharacterized protein YtfP
VLVVEDSALERALAVINSSGGFDGVLDALFDSPQTRLAAYGTLRPGESNHTLVANLDGAWVDGTVQGVRFIANDYPAFLWRPGGAEVPVSVLTSAALPAHWARLDDFEGPEYRRILVPVSLPNGTALVANLYQYIGT